MIVVSDTSPLNYLILIGEENILTKLFGSIVIPQAVSDELLDAGASSQVREWSQNLPDWVKVRHAILTPAASLDLLDRGEREAILLAQELSADLLLVDDKQARQAAVNLGIAITGTVGIVDKAARAGLIDLKIGVEKLQKTNFFISDDLLNLLLENET